ncbi:MAG: MFS transporter [Bacillota bacterium]|nr:MFS transporter [Bacillota bacterium]
MKILTWDINLKVRLIGETLFNTLFWMYFPFLTLYFSDKFGKSTAGLLMSVPPLMGIIGSLLGGFLSDRWGRRSTMLVGAFMQAGMFALFALSIGNWFDYFAYMGISFGGSIYQPASSAMVADLTPEKDLRNVFATFVTAINIGAVFGPMLGSIFFFHYRSELLWTCTLVTLIYSIAIFFMIRETIPASAKKSVQSHTFSSVLKEQGKNYKIIFYDKIFALYILAGVFVTIGFKQLNLYLAVYVKEMVPSQTLFSWDNWSLELSNLEVFGWIMGLNGLMFVLCVIPVTKWFEHWSDRNTFVLSSFIFGFGMFLVGFTTNIWLLFIFTFIFTIGEIMNAPVTSSFVSKYAPEKARGQYMGASNLQYSIGRFLAPLTVILSTSLSAIGVFGFVFFCMLISVGLYILLFKSMQVRNYGKNRVSL